MSTITKQFFMVILLWVLPSLGCQSSFECLPESPICQNGACGSCLNSKECYFASESLPICSAGSCIGCQTDVECNFMEKNFFCKEGRCIRQKSDPIPISLTNFLITFIVVSSFGAVAIITLALISFRNSFFTDLSKSQATATSLQSLDSEKTTM